MLNKKKQIDRFGSSSQKNHQFNQHNRTENYECHNSGYFSYAIQPHYFPFHFGYPIGYSPFSYYSPGLLSAYDYYPLSEVQMNPKNLSPIESKIQIKTQQKQIIDLENLGNIKVQSLKDIEPKHEFQDFQEHPIKYNNKNIKNQYLGQTRKINQKKDYEKTINLDILFKKLINNFINDDNNITMARLQFQKDLRKINELNGNQILMDEIFNIIKKKFTGFKKTKQEMIKYIIRRTYHNYKVNKIIDCKPQFDRLQLFHDRNLSIHKSMNNDFLKKQFSNKLFVEIYKNFLNQMDQQFQKQNDQRIQKIITILTTVWIEQQTRSILCQRKLPWTLSYKKKVKKIALELLRDYQHYVEDVKDKELN